MHVYNEEVARHYAAYRPALHTDILSAALGTQRFEHGVDIGCGTGASAIALASFCQHVTAVDSGAEMLAQAQPHEAVSYHLGSEAHIPSSKPEIDIVSLAGVLPYVDIAALRGTCQRVCKAGAVIVVYDFKVDLTPVLQGLGLSVPTKAAPYDHSRTLDREEGFSTLAQAQEACDFSLTAAQAAHLVLANEDRIALLQSQVSGTDLYDHVHDTLIRQGFANRLTAQRYWSVHRLTV